MDDSVQFRAADVLNEDGDRWDYASDNTLNNSANFKDGDMIVLYWAKVKATAAVWDGEQDLDTTTTATTAFLAGESAENARSKVETNADTADTESEPVPIDGNPKQYANGNGRNDNHTILTYGANGHMKWERAQVTTYGFDLTKAKELAKDSVHSDEYPLLDGAKFSVRKAIDKGRLDELIAAKQAEALEEKQTTQSDPTATLTDVEKAAAETAVKGLYEEVKVQTGSGLPAESYIPYDYPKDGGKLYFAKTEKTEAAPTALDQEPNALALDGKYSYPQSYVDTHVFYRYLGDGISAGGTSGIEPTDKKSAHLYGLDCGIYVLTEEKASDRLQQARLPDRGHGHRRQGHQRPRKRRGPLQPEKER